MTPPLEADETISFTSHGTRCSAWYLNARTDTLNSPQGRPCLVMGHGFAATRDSGLLPFAERFAHAGVDVMMFDYRGFGASDGTPRQNVHHRRHRQDFHAAIAAARARPGVDPDRIALWGSSYSGGHVLAVAAQDPTLGAVITQAAVLDGLATIAAMRRYTSVAATCRLVGAAIRDIWRAGTQRAPYLIPAVGAPGALAVLTAPGAQAGNDAVIGPTYRNEVCARVVLRTAMNRPIRHAHQIGCPTLLIVADNDNIAPPAVMHKAARRIGSLARVVTYPCGHFDVYSGPVFDRSVPAQVAFLRDALAPRNTDAC